MRCHFNVIGTCVCVYVLVHVCVCMYVCTCHLWMSLFYLMIKVAATVVGGQSIYLKVAHRFVTTLSPSYEMYLVIPLTLAWYAALANIIQVL